MRKSIATILALGLMAGVGFTTGGASAGTCDSDIMVFSYNDTVRGASLQPYGLGCIATDTAEEESGQDTLDHRYIFPGSSAISLRYPEDEVGGYTPGAITAVLDGAGFDKERVLLVREEQTTGSIFYDSAVFSLPHLESTSGCLDITVSHSITKKKKLRNGKVKNVKKVVFKQSTTWRTVDWPTCP